jgi:hypothetical protein
MVTKCKLTKNGSINSIIVVVPTYVQPNIELWKESNDKRVKTQSKEIGAPR